jgi:uncharacterized protein YbaR (Trm112 family)
MSIHADVLMVQCPSCEGLDVIKGSRQTGVPYWKCKTCGKTFTLTSSNDECIFCRGPLSEGQMICYNCERTYSSKK